MVFCFSYFLYLAFMKKNHLGVKRKDVGVYKLVFKKKKFKGSVPVKLDEPVNSYTITHESLNAPVQIKVYQ